MTIDVTIDGGVARVVLNQPARKNAVNLAMRVDLGVQLEALALDPAVRVVVLSGVGSDFCSGMDVGEFGNNDIASTAARARLLYRVINALASMDKPVIAAVRGVALGAGWSLALACDVVVASDTAKFGQAFGRLGLAPDAGSAYFLSRLIGPARATDLIFSGRNVPAPEALALGLVGEVLPDAELDARVAARAAELARAPTLALGMTKRMLRLCATPSLEQFLDMEIQMQSLLIRSEDHQEGVRAFREKRAPQFKGR